MAIALEDSEKDSISIPEDEADWAGAVSAGPDSIGPDSTRIGVVGVEIILQELSLHVTVTVFTSELEPD